MAANEKPYTGLTAAIKIGTSPSAVTIAYVSGFNLSLSKDIIEILAFGHEYKEKVPSIKDWSATIDGTVALAANGSQKQLFDAFESGDPITVGCYLSDAVYFEGSALVSSFEIDAAPDDAITLSSELAGTGAVTLNGLA